MRSQLFDLLESRRLFAVDLTGSIGLDVAAPYITDNDAQANVVFTVRNVGETNSPIPVLVNFYLSKDLKFKEGIDPAAGASIAASGVNAGKKVTIDGDLQTDTATPGKYYLVGVIDPLGSYTGEGNPYGESNRSNNVIFSAEPIVTVVPHLASTAINGTAGKDVLKLTQNSSHLIVTNNGEVSAIQWATVSSLQIQLGASADKLLTDETVSVRLQASGGGGNDTLIGGKGNDELSGAGGKDRVYGQAGSDYVLGGGANDYLEGGDDNDTLSGGAGNDKLVGGAGPDRMIAGLGDDQFYAKDDTGDTLSGNAGNDSAQSDVDDFKTSIEAVIA